VNENINEFVYIRLKTCETAGGIVMIDIGNKVHRQLQEFYKDKYEKEGYRVILEPRKKNYPLIWVHINLTL
jgi:hypothetical protein